jgi:pilus assembly protein CpaB
MKKIYIIALILAFLTGISVYSFAGSLEKASKREYVEVVTAAVNIPERTALTAEMLVMKSIPVESVLPTAVRSIAKAIGLFTDYAMETGEVLSSAKLHTQGEKTSGLTYFVPEGKRAFTLSVDAVSGVGGFILPGDHVDIIGTMVFDKKDGTTTIQVPTSLVIAQNVEVLAAGSSIKVEENGVNVSYATITLSVSLEDAVTLNLAAANGKLRMVLRSPLDKDVAEVSPQTMGKIADTLG